MRNLSFAGVAFALVAYLSLRGGGYDGVVRGDVGVVVWWVLLVGLAAGLLPAARISRDGWVITLLLAALGVWTALGIGWSESAELSMSEVTRVLTYLGVLVLALLLPGRSALRAALWGISAAVAAIAVLALLSRLQPGPFPANEAIEFFPTVGSRLAYPLNYWNGLAILIGIGIPLVLAGAAAARRPVGALPLAVIPAMALAAFYTFSRGGVAVIVIGLLALLALHPRRLALIGLALPAGLGSGALIWAASRRDALENGLGNDLAGSQGDEMLILTLLVVALTGAAAYGIRAAAVRGMLPSVAIPRRGAAIAFGLVAVLAVVAAVGAGAPGEASDRWQEFKDPGFAGEGAARFESAGGRGRYQWWETAIDAGTEQPVLGIGPGTYVHYWNRNGTLETSIQDAHSLYLEAFAELGIPGLILVVGLLGGVLVIGTRRALAAEDEQRILLAGATAAAAAFAAAAAIDWVWELSVIPVCFLLIAAAIVRAPGAGGQQREEGPAAVADQSPAPLGVPVRVGAALGALLALVVIAIPLGGASALESSEEQAGAGDLVAALGDARRARDLQPYAASPRAQEALIFERAGELEAAKRSALEAIERERLNWQHWLLAARIDARLGEPRLALREYRRAVALNPRSPLFRGGEGAPGAGSNRSG